MSVIGLLRKGFIAGLLGVLILPNALFVVAYGRNYLPGLFDALTPRTFPERSDRDLLANSQWGWYRIIDFTRRFLPPGATVLVFRQNDFVYYGNHRVIRDVDPRMIPIYRQPDKEAAYRALLERDVRYVYVPPYDAATRYNTHVAAMLGDPAMTRLVMEERGTRLMRLLDPPERHPLATRQLMGAEDAWSLYDAGQEWTRVRLPHLARTGESGIVWLQSGEGSWDVAPPRFGKGAFRPGATLHVRGRVQGNGWLRLYVIEYPAQAGSVHRLQSLRESALQADTPLDIELQLRTSPATSSLRFLFAVRGDGPVQVGSFEVRQVEEALPYGVAALGRDTPPPGDAATRAGDEGMPQFSGPGHYLVPPSHYGLEGAGEVTGTTRFAGEQAFHIDLAATGPGRAVLGAVTFDIRGTPETVPLESLFFASGQPTRVERILVVPADTREFRVGIVPTTDAESLLDWTKRYFFRDLPPRHVMSDGGSLTLATLTTRPAPEALDDPRIRDCVLRARQFKPDATVLCRPR